VQYSTLHPSSGSLQTEFHLCPRRQTPATCLVTSMSWTYLDTGNHCVSIPFIVLWSLSYIWIQVSSVGSHTECSCWPWRGVLVTGVQPCCRWENHHAPAVWPHVLFIQPIAVECLVPFSYSLLISLARPNGDGRCYAPRCAASRQVNQRLALGVKLLCGRFPHIHNYKTVHKSHKISLKSVKNSLWSKHSITLLTSIETFGNQIGWEFSYD
jgi:hypothetical protein